MRPPDTTIPCDICKGSKRHPTVPKTPCGACFATGLSTSPWDQRRNGTTVTLTATELSERERTRGWVIHTRKEAPLDRVRDRDGVLRYIALVSWPNPNYRGA